MAHNENVSLIEQERPDRLQRLAISQEEEKGKVPENKSYVLEFEIWNVV